jgi:hypothetical protein
MRPQFSIVIITHNRFPWLKFAVESALNQTLPCEVVIIDHGSDDKTHKFIQGLGNRVVYRRNFVNRGRAAAVNLGVHLARGNWIKWLDDDDRLGPQCIETLAQAIAPFPEAVIVSCQATQVDQHHQELGQTPIVGEGGAGTVHQVLQEDIHFQMLFDRLALGSTAQIAVRKDAFLCAGGWDTNLSNRSCEALESWIRIAQYGDAIFVNQPLSYITCWPGNRSQRLCPQEQQQAQLALKQKLYGLVHPKYQHQSRHHNLPLAQQMAIEYYHLATNAACSTSESRRHEILGLAQLNTKLGTWINEIEAGLQSLHGQKKLVGLGH